MSWIALSSPAGRPWHFAGLELIITATFLATMVHALRGTRDGDPRRLFDWLTIVAYGLMMELIAFHYWQNYTHATFTVQLYDGLLPLYVVFLYPCFHYLGVRGVRARGLPPLAAASATGLAIFAIDVPFDTAGVPAGWWVWASASESIAPDIYAEAVRTRWLDVPVTSYLWYLVFGGILAGLLDAAWPRLAHRGWAARLAAAPLVAMGVILGGVLSFQVLFWLPRSVGIPDDLVVASVIAVGCWAATRGDAHQRAPTWIRGATAALQLYMIAVLLTLTAAGSLADGIPRLLVSLGAMGIAVLAMGIPRPAPVPEVVASGA